MKRKRYKEFIIKTVPFNFDLISGLLWELDISGLIEENDFIKIFSEKNNLAKKEIENFLEKLQHEKLLNEYSVAESEIENKNWNEEWEKNLNIIKVSDKIIIKPSTKNYLPKNDEVVLIIDPKMSFGTGEHQTTKLVLRLLEKYIKPGMRVLDIGSGTGILAIASVKLGASEAVAVDNDEICFENGLENIRLNNVEDKVKVRIGEIKDIEKNNFNLILANIQKNIIIQIADDIRKRLKKDGFIILSGLLINDEDEILKKYQEAGFSLIEKQIMDEWVALVFLLKQEEPFPVL